MNWTKLVLSIVIISSFFFACQSESEDNGLTFHAQDINNFWEAYDKIQTTNDSLEQMAHLENLFLKPASKGQKAMIEARNYTPEQYLSAIKAYPKFWASIRENTLRNAEFSTEINEGVNQLKKLYPSLKPSTIYYTMGCFRSPGTTTDHMILIGSEFAFEDLNTDVSEFPESMSHLGDYHKTNPIKNLVFLNLHEYIHTQQKEMVHNLLSLSIYEGVAEFVANKTMPPSPNPCISYGRKHKETVRKKFEKDMFTNWKRGDWLWNDKNNDFGESDMAYFVGYDMCERYYNAAEDKKAAIHKLINLDFHNEEEIEAFVNGTKYLSAPLENLYQNFEAARPTVIEIKEFKNSSENVSPSTKTITLVFSEALDTRYSSTGLGPLGRAHFPKVSSREFSEDGMSFTYEVDLEPNKKYQLLLENGYRNANENPLKPYLVEFSTKE